MKFIRHILLMLLPGLLFYLAWPPLDFYILGLVAWVPLLYSLDKIQGKRGQYWYIFGVMSVFNGLTTWWVWNASPGGAIAAVIVNGLLMSLPFYFYQKYRTRLGRTKAYILLVSLWMGFEYLHLNWDITWPWLSLGNLFAKHNYTVQWYEYTGMLGGSLWVMLSNVMVDNWRLSRGKKQLSFALVTMFVPLFIGIAVGASYDVKDREKEEVLVVQPNLDPYREKFKAGAEVKAVIEMLEQAEKNVTPNTKLVVFPETAIVEYLDEDRFYNFRTVRLIDEFLSRHPGLNVVSGASTYNMYSEGEKMSPTARDGGGGRYYESYNSGLAFRPNSDIQVYHKSKLVPGVEKMPYPKVFKFLEAYIQDLGGITGSLGSDDTVTVFDEGENASLAPLICYESVFPDVVRRFGVKGAELILVMTNDGWWGDTDGYKQHMYYGCLRAIENRKEVVRAANTGISCHIDSKGKILSTTEWWQKQELLVSVTPLESDTFYSKNGDYLGKIASFIGLFMLLGQWVRRLTRKNAS